MFKSNIVCIFETNYVTAYTIKAIKKVLLNKKFIYHINVVYIVIYYLMSVCNFL